MTKNNSYIIEYLPLFEDDLNEIVDYILFKLHNKSAALKLIDAIETAILERSYNPISFQTFHSLRYRKDTYYKIHVNHFIVYYVVKQNVMEVRRLLYNKRNIDYLIWFYSCKLISYIIPIILYSISNLIKTVVNVIVLWYIFINRVFLILYFVM